MYWEKWKYVYVSEGSCRMKGSLGNLQKEMEGQTFSELNLCWDVFHKLCDYFSRYTGWDSIVKQSQEASWEMIKSLHVQNNWVLPRNQEDAVSVPYAD